MSIEAIATCSDCGVRVYWKLLSYAPRGGGWATVEGGHFTCYVTPAQDRMPHRVTMPKLTDQSALESWLQS